VRDWGVLKWRLLYWLLGACAFAMLGAWIYITGTVCQSPLVPNPATGNIVRYNCHGSIVYLTALQDGLLKWLVPAFVAVGFLGRAASRRIKGT
jgi:hypothetical protein